jgi:hypothetical protein
MAFVPKVVDGECREFLVIVPVGVQFKNPAVLQEIADALHKEFPETVFTVASAGNQKNFIVYPVLGATGAHQIARMPVEGVVEAIGDFLETNFATIPKRMLH